MVNVAVGPEKVVFEIQLVHQMMYAARKTLNGHKAYAEYRSYVEMLTYSGQLAPPAHTPVTTLARPWAARARAAATAAKQTPYDVVFSHKSDQIGFVKQLIRGLGPTVRCFSQMDLDPAQSGHWMFQWRKAFMNAKLRVQPFRFRP
jgi:hypothetical protein